MTWLRRNAWTITALTLMILGGLIIGAVIAQ